MVTLTLLLNLPHQRYRPPCQLIGTGSWTPAIYPGNPDVAGSGPFIVICRSCSTGAG
jgi:hypothetical protein